MDFERGVRVGVVTKKWLAPLAWLAYSYLKVFVYIKKEMGYIDIPH
jgi:hypothetical protein